jgi:hypothetical protein
MNQENRACTANEDMRIVGDDGAKAGLGVDLNRKTHRRRN